MSEFDDPLRPLYQPDDERRYLPVDSIEEMFGRFTAAFGDPADWIAKGHLIVVTGDRGCGKTSLIQRCAYWLKTRPQPNCKLVIVDFSDEQWTDTEDQRTKRVFSRILDLLGQSEDLRTSVLERIRTYEADLNDAYYHLSQALGSRQTEQGEPLPPVALAVLLPGYPKPAEVKRYYEIARPGIFFFAEVFEVADIHAIRFEMPRLNRANVGVHHLGTGVLNPGDAYKLVDWFRGAGHDSPEFPDEIVRVHLNGPVEYYSKVSIRELTKLAWGLLCVAKEEAADRVTETHVARYYEQLVFGDGTV